MTGLSVIGVGYPRTGTSSLKAALDQLGFGPCYHMSELFTLPAHWQIWLDAVSGKPVDWDALFAGYHATADVPGCLFFRELAAHYPDAKLVLTMRDPDSWFASTQATVLSPMLETARRARPLGLMEMMGAIGWNGDDPATHEKDAMIAKFAAHNAAVQRDIPSERLLVWETSEGWEPLCGFLGVPVPDHPFPHVNSTKAFREMVSGGMEGGGGLDAIKRSHAEQAARQRGTKP